MIPPTRSRALLLFRQHSHSPHTINVRRPPTAKPHRTLSSQQPTAQKAPASATTIPGPTWLWLEPIYEPFRAYGRAQRRRPYRTQFISSLVIYLVGDIVAQSIGPADAEKEAVGQSKDVDEDEEERGWVQVWSEERDWARTARALFIGGAAAVPGYRWFLWLSSSFNYSSKILSLGTKVLMSFIYFYYDMWRFADRHYHRSP